jgi:hypothetical protein
VQEKSPIPKLSSHLPWSPQEPHIDNEQSILAAPHHHLLHSHLCSPPNLAKTARPIDEALWHEVHHQEMVEVVLDKTNNALDEAVLKIAQLERQIDNFNAVLAGISGLLRDVSLNP